MARNLTSPGIELGRALCWGRVSGAHFLYKDKAACRSFYVLFYPRTCVDRFSSQANKSTLIASAISPGNVAIAAIFAHTKEAIHTIASFKKKLLRLSDRCRLKSRPCWGRVSGAHFLYKDKAACRSFYVLFYPRTCVDRFSSQANKSTLIASAISPGNVAIAAIFAHTKEAIHTIASFKKKLLRLSDRCRLKSRVPGRVQCPDW